MTVVAKARHRAPQRRTASSILPFREIAPMRGLFRHFSVRFLNDAAEEGDRA